jgi:membrane protein DedA with SNARE-associated domain
MLLDIGPAGGVSTVVLAVILGVVLALDTIPIIGVFVPADVAILAAAGTRGPVGAAALELAVVAGSLAGWTVSFTAGRFLSGPLRRSWLGRRVGAERWAGAERLVANGGGRMVLAAPFLPVFNTIVPIAAGSLRMPYRQFLAYAAAGSALWGGGYVVAGLIAQRVGGAVLGRTDTLTTLLFALPGLAIGWVVLARVRRTVTAQSRQRNSDTTATQPTAARMATRSRTPLTYPRPMTRVVRPEPASRGTTRPLPKRLTRRTLSPTCVAVAVSTAAAAVSSSAPLLATAWITSATPGVSYGGNGQPGVHDTAPDATANGAAAARAAPAAGTRGRSATAASARPVARARMPDRYTTGIGAPGAPASLT